MRAHTQRHTHIHTHIHAHKVKCSLVTTSKSWLKCHSFAIFSLHAQSAQSLFVTLIYFVSQHFLLPEILFVAIICSWNGLLLDSCQLEYKLCEGRHCFSTDTTGVTQPGEEDRYQGMKEVQKLPKGKARKGDLNCLSEFKKERII